MERNSIVVLSEMRELMFVMAKEGDEWEEKANKSAAARLRKDTLAFAKLAKEFRSLSVAESKN